MTLQHPGKTWGNGWLLQVNELGEFVHPEMRLANDWTTWEMVEKCCSEASPYWSFFQWVLDVYCGGIYHMKMNNLTTIRRMPVLKMCDDRFRRFQPRSVEQHQLASTLPLLPGRVGKIQLGRENGWLERKTEELHPEVFYIVKPDHLCQAGAMDVNLFCGGTKSMKELPELVFPRAEVSSSPQNWSVQPWDVKV